MESEEDVVDVVDNRVKWIREEENEKEKESGDNAS